MQLFMLYICFFVSGIAGLIYEVLWSKYLALCVGSTGVAQIIVLATFMGGMALGSHLLGRAVDRSEEPLKFYMLLEFGIGAYALLFHPIFIFIQNLFFTVAGKAGVDSSVLTFGKITVAVAAVIIPSFLMGGTLPAMSRHVVRNLKDLGPRISRLYFLNSFGAVCGCIIAGFFLISSFGLMLSMIIGACFSISAGMIALFLLPTSRASKDYLSDGSECNEIDANAEDPCLAGWAFGVVLGCVSLSGAVSMMYEVAWIRMLTLVLGSSTYSFSIMLATFILGLSIGGWLLSLRRKTTGYAMIFGLSEASVGLLVLLMIPFYVRLPYVFNQVASSLSREPVTFGLYQLSKFILCALVMILPCILQGITLPAATKILMKDVGTLGRRVGYIFAINTAGTLLGAVGAGFLGLPLLGIKGTLELAAGLNCALAVAILLTRTWSSTRIRLAGFTVLAIILCWSWYFLGMAEWNSDVMSMGVYRMRYRIATYDDFLASARKKKHVYYKDGVDATVAVVDEDKGTKTIRQLLVNGKVDASTSGDMATQKMLAHLPLIIGDSIDNVLVVGIGSGCTIGSVLAHNVKQVDVVEISKDVFDASKYFSDTNGRYWEDGRVNIYFEDAKTFLQVVNRKYDLIICEPSNPWMAGVAGVFSREHFLACRNKLTDRGLFVQWMQTYELENKTFFMMIETLSGVFPYYSIWTPGVPDVIIVCSPSAYDPNIERMVQRINKPEVQTDLNSYQMGSPLTIFLMQMVDRASVYSHVPWFGLTHSDYFPKLDYLAPRGFFIGTESSGVDWLDRRSQSPVNADLWVKDYLSKYNPSNEEMRSAYNFAVTNRFRGLYRRLALCIAQEWVSRYPDDPAARIALCEEVPPDWNATRNTLSELSEVEVISYKARKMIVRDMRESYFARRNVMRVENTDKLLSMLQDLDTSASSVNKPDTEIRLWLGELLYDRGAYRDAVLCLNSLQIDNSSMDKNAQFKVHLIMYESCIADGAVDAAESIAFRLTKLQPENRRAWLMWAEAYAKREKSGSDR